MKLGKSEMKNPGILFILALALFAFNGCSEKNDVTAPADQFTGKMDDLKIPDGFDFSMTKNVRLSVTLADFEVTSPLKIPVSVYTSNPESNGKLIGTFATTAEGRLECTVTVPSYLDTLYLASNYIGIPNLLAVSVNGSSANADVTKRLDNIQSGSLALSKELANYKTLGTWNSAGVPGYLWPVRDRIDQNLLDNLNQSLPERGSILNHHPEFLASGNQTNILLKDSAEVFVTFVHEGAGYLNVFGFYYYNASTPPAKISDIEPTMTIVFPNVSYKGSGGGLISGDKVKLGNFSANTVIGWFLLSNGYKSPIVTDGNWRFFSSSNLNPEATSALRQHLVALNDVGNNRVILGFEDIARDNSGCDNDFNDAMFFVTANPFTSVNTNNIALIDVPVNNDRDNDGVANQFDEYPDDPERAFNNYFPAKDSYGTLAFEDLWPAKGDYDFNDLVLDYNYHIVTSGSNKVADLNAEYKVKAIGAGYKNGFGIHFPVSSSNIKLVTGQKYYHGIISNNANGTEAGQTATSIVVFDDAYQVMQAGGEYINTLQGSTRIEPKSVFLKVIFSKPVFLSDLGTAPFNPFLIVNKERGKEIHLINNPPTSLANNSYFGKSDDRSNPAQNRYYTSTTNLSWVLNFPESFEYPVEKEPIIKGYNYFRKWAESMGIVYQDWYQNKSGYRNSQSIYK